MTQHKRFPTVLTIAGSDPSGGAGVQADLKVFSALGCYGMSVLTSLTAQNTCGVSAVESVSARFVHQQLCAIFEDIEVDAIKIGVLHRSEIVNVVASVLEEQECRNVVLDPVMIAKSGDSLISHEAIASMKDRLLPIARILTPNLPEAARLNGTAEPTDVPGMVDLAQDLLKLGSQAVLVKGGHLASEHATDVFVETNDRAGRLLTSERIDTDQTHGTGCALSSAIAAHLALGHSLFAAVQNAKEYLHGALLAGSSYRLGKGQGPPGHFFQVWAAR